VACIAELVSRFDVIALQEVRRTTKALRFLLERLSPAWRVIASDVTEGPAGNGERLAFLYDADRVQPSGLVGEIVLPPVEADPQRQFARTPYFAGFSRAGTEFTLASVHVLWGKNTAERLPEVAAFAQWMRDWADRPNDWNNNLMVLGDFNLDRIGDPLYEAFVNSGLWPPTELNNVPRTIFDDDNTRHFYDQIAWFTNPDGTSLLQGMSYAQKAGSFDFIPHPDRAHPHRNLLAHLRPLPALGRISAHVRRASLGRPPSEGCKPNSMTLKDKCQSTAQAIVA
jgi:hypothetical protein